ncbi:MAG: NADH-quinone oxidoreductase subunit NuoE [Syntrophobacteraceae bacterium]
MTDFVPNDEEREMQEELQSLLAEFPHTRGHAIPILQTVQSRLGFLPPVAMHLVAEHLDLSASEIYGVATFYNQFRFHPPGKHQIKVCLGTACHVVGADIILENFERKLGIKDGETTADREFSLERVACVGCCALAPVAIVDEAAHGHMAPSKVEGILLGFEIEKEQAQIASRTSERE